MNILVIGNGFDLAHGLPAKYTDFLDFIKSFIDCYKRVQNNQIDWVYYDTHKGNNAFLKKWFSSFYENDNGQSKAEKEATVKIIEELKENIESNIWIEYFLQNPMYQKENWIDFENEISKVIHSLNDDMHGLGADYSLDDKVKKLSNDFLLEKYSKYIWVATSGDESSDCNNSEITFREIRDGLLIDLNKLTRALEIYLTTYLNEVQYGEELFIIKDIFEKKDEQGKVTHLIDTKIISFNYTATFKRIYKHNFDIDYIHGKADINNTIDTNDMVLGIDEYLGKKKRNKQVEFVAFKKFYQRIHKGTGCTYKEWIDTIKGEFADYQTELEKSKTEKNIMNLKATINKLKKQYLNKHHVYIFGHSLDVTDKDILRDLILNDNVHTTIFYHNKDAMGQQIANLVKVIGQEELIRRTGGSTKTIEFKQQQAMEEVEN